MNEKKTLVKEIAILSMQRIVNFGSVLQAYSLREILHEITDASVSFLDIEPTPSLKSRKSIHTSMDYETPAAYPPGLLQRGKRWTITRLSSINKKGIRRFMEQELALDGAANQKNYDCVVIGSDEVFNHKNGICLQLHGNVSQADKVISYAASCGSAVAEDIAPEDLETVRETMSRFSALSVRDAATQAYVSGLYDGGTVRHLDPVLVGNLHQRAHRKVWLKNYLLVYAYGQRIRTEEEISAIRSFAKRHNLKILAMGGSQFWCDLYMPASPFRLLDYFAFADYVITDTFHGSIFSVINQKKFAVICRKTNQNKLTSLLEDLKLTGRMIHDLKDLEPILTEEIDYESVEKILERERQRTRCYLQEQIGG